ncbi:DNA replication/repair protein RecF [Anaeromicrobium sediminis]|uniref:DNA replication and repair protein RecF n=1 Tax=Anaeromicrobium sediminis TaxID=1478221 RepID=A0A267MI01_9FIRM|nr:DNA replication/repair protein RecF [Anaeromicrobium sediminis]PAB58430.1 DNA replication/repair protein RecF [Anaeromicrobium sediminis]
MYLKRLKLINFRNYKELELDLNEKLNIFVGNNAQGKTNIVEAIYMSSLGKSFRTSKDKELIMFNRNQSYIKVEGQKKYSNVEVEIKLVANKKKRIKVNKLSLSKNSEILNNIYVVIFSPEDLRLIKEGPSERRKFMDNELSQMKPYYFHNLNSYNKILIQRNHLLKNMRGKDNEFMLEVWDEKLIDVGVKIIEERARFVKRITPLSRLIHRKITNNRENLEVTYLSNIDYVEDTNKLKDMFKKQLKEALKIDIKRGTTTVGPHRDDLGVFIDKIDIRSFGSQGQQRTCALSLKLAEIELVKGETGEYPVLLLDDVMSELDINRQNFLIKALKDVQLFITTTEINNLEELNMDEAFIFHVENAQVNRSR